VFVLPSFYEGLPLVVIEALACGCTVVVTDLPGIRPWLQASLPGAPVLYVKPPRMVDVDTPYEGDLPEFEYDLAAALAQAAAMPHAAFDTTAVSWDGLCARIRDVFA
jgi:glycosyltransferase involved in cell wall biosynthesis